MDSRCTAISEYLENNREEFDRLGYAELYVETFRKMTLIRSSQDLVTISIDLYPCETSPQPAATEPKYRTIEVYGGAVKLLEKRLEVILRSRSARIEASLITACVFQKCFNLNLKITLPVVELNSVCVDDILDVVKGLEPCKP